VALPDDFEDHRLEGVTEAAVTPRKRAESRYRSGRTTDRSVTTEQHDWIEA
jgi:hypothetical protein